MGCEFPRLRLGKRQTPRTTRVDQCDSGQVYICAAKEVAAAACKHQVCIFDRVSARMLAGEDRAVGGGQAPEPESFELRPPVPVPNFANSESRLRIASGFEEVSSRCGHAKASFRSLELREDVGLSVLLRVA
jgi:hypothetical protein